MARTKVILIHRGALKAKYGMRAAGVHAALARLVAADAQRGLASCVIAIDQAADMAPFRAARVGPRDDFEGAKNAVDAIDAKLSPHYILLVGGPDVIPIQRLENPAGGVVYGEEGDWDPNLPSDLPYACDVPYSKNPADFQGPTRVVGRIPDVPAAKSPSFLVGLLDVAAQAKPLPPEAYEAWLGVTAKAWRRSSMRSAKSIFGDAGSMLESPPSRSQWSKRALASRLHFINCHGAPNDSAFYGDGGEGRRVNPLAMTTEAIDGKILPGTVLSAQCCYGAQVFSPLKKHGAERPGFLGIALSYLAQGAYGVFGSTNIAFGPDADDEENDFSDVVCRIFLERVRAGASLGRAALEARHGYLKLATPVSPLKLKTLAQFYLLGDPSIHPVDRAATPFHLLPVDEQAQLAAQRARRREAQRAEGRALAAAAPRLEEVGISDAVRDQMIAIADDFGMRSKIVKAFAAPDEEIAVLVTKLSEEGGGTKGGPRFGAIEARVRDGRVVKWKYAVSR